MSEAEHQHDPEDRVNFAFVAWMPKQPLPLLTEADRVGLLAWLRELADLRERQAQVEGHHVEVFGETPALLRQMADSLDKWQLREARNREF